VISCDLLIARSADDEASTATGNFATCSGEVEQVPEKVFQATLTPVKAELAARSKMQLGRFPCGDAAEGKGPLVTRSSCEQT
jgi:hypothetical protein